MFFAGSLMPPRSHRAVAAVPFSLGIHIAVVGGLVALPLLGNADPPPVVGIRPPVIDSIPTALLRVHVPPPPAVPARPAPAAPRAPARALAEAPATIPVPLTDHLPAPEAITEDLGACVGCAFSTGPSGHGDPNARVGDDTGTPTGTGTGDAIVPVGGNVNPPVKVRHVDPLYPELAKRAGVQGIVIIECVIDREGRVASRRVLRSIPLLDAAALAAVEQWRYRPTLLNGVQVQVLMTVTVHFNLR
jgi:protein TonB